MLPLPPIPPALYILHQPHYTKPPPSPNYHPISNQRWLISNPSNNPIQRLLGPPSISPPPNNLLSLRLRPQQPQPTKGSWPGQILRRWQEISRCRAGNYGPKWLRFNAYGRQDRQTGYVDSRRPVQPSWLWRGCQGQDEDYGSAWGVILFNASFVLWWHWVCLSFAWCVHIVQWPTIPGIMKLPDQMDLLESFLFLPFGCLVRFVYKLEM